MVFGKDVGQAHLFLPVTFLAKVSETVLRINRLTEEILWLF